MCRSLVPEFMSDLSGPDLLRLFFPESTIPLSPNYAIAGQAMSMPLYKTGTVIDRISLCRITLQIFLS